jgi:cell division protein FtsB
VISIKKMCIRALFVVECVAFALIYICGSYGVRTLMALRADAQRVKSQVEVLQHEVAALEQELIAWNSHPFYKEKIAREQLHMAREGDTIFYLN